MTFILGIVFNERCNFLRISKSVGWVGGVCCLWRKWIVFCFSDWEINKWFFTLGVLNQRVRCSGKSPKKWMFFNWSFNWKKRSITSGFVSSIDILHNPTRCFAWKQLQMSLWESDQWSSKKSMIIQLLEYRIPQPLHVSEKNGLQYIGNEKSYQRSVGVKTTRFSMAFQIVIVLLKKK